MAWQEADYEVELWAHHTLRILDLIEEMDVLFDSERNTREEKLCSPSTDGGLVPAWTEEQSFPCFEHDYSSAKAFDVSSSLLSTLV